MSYRVHAKVPVQQKTLAGPPPKSGLLQRTCSCSQHIIAGAQCPICRSEQSTLLLSQRALGSSLTSTPAQENVPPVSSDFGGASRFGHDFSRIPAYSSRPPALQTKLKINQPGEVYKREFEFNLNDHNSAPRVLDSVAVSERRVKGGGGPARQNPRFGQPLPPPPVPAGQNPRFGQPLPPPPVPARQNPNIGQLPVAAGQNPRFGQPLPPPPVPARPKKKQAGVDSFVVTWKKHDDAGERDARLRLDYAAKFKKDGDHDPALAEFRQNAMTYLKITDGPGKEYIEDRTPMHDDGYSRNDDDMDNKLDDVYFASHDEPGIGIKYDPQDPLSEDSVIDYAFSAEQMIIDTSQNDKVIAKLGPHKATITGKHPRDYKGVPTKLSIEN